MKKLTSVVAAFFILSLSAQAMSGKDAYKASCLACHGENAGGGQDATQGPNLTILKDAYFKEQFKAILDGKRKGKGTEAMLKALKDSKLSDKDIQAAADYAMKLPEVKANKHIGGGDKVAGQQKFMICATCHGQKGEGYSNPALPAPRLKGQSDFYIIEAVKGFKQNHRGNDTPGGMQMKAMAGTLVTDDDIKNVAAYIRSLSE